MIRLVLRLVGRGPFRRSHPGHDFPAWVSEGGWRHVHKIGRAAR